MRLILIIAIIVITALCLGCGGDDSTGPDISGGVIMPLEMGNKWYGEVIDYEGGDPVSSQEITIEILDTIYYSGECWYLTKERDFRPSFGYANRADGLWMVMVESNTVTHGPDRYCKYPASIGDSYSTGNAQVDVQSIDTINVASIGAVESMVCYYYLPDTGDAITETIWWAPNIGMIKSVYKYYGDSTVYRLDSVDFVTPPPQ